MRTEWKESQNPALFFDSGEKDNFEFWAIIRQSILGIYYEKDIKKESMSLLSEELKQLQQMDIMSLDRKQLVNAEDIVIDRNKSIEERMDSYLKQTGNPFAQNIGDYLVQVDFAEDTEDTVDDRLILLMKRKVEMPIG